MLAPVVGCSLSAGIARAVLYLASEEASVVSGRAMPADGGASATRT